MRPNLRDISVSVKSGEVLCFVSSDIATNYDVLCCISGWARCDGGCVLLDGKKIGWRHPLSPVTIGYSPRTEYHSHLLTTRQSLEFFCSLRGIVKVKREVDRIIKMFKLDSVADFSPNLMSDGTLARFRVAVAMVGEPDVVLLHQPFGSLDSSGKSIVFDAINWIKKRSKIVILTSNSIDECAHLASRVAIIVCGQVVLVSSPQGIRTRFSDSYSLTARVASCDKNQADILVQSLRQRFPQSEIFVDSLSYLHVLLPFRTDSLGEIFRLMESVKKHLQVSDFVLRHTTLDNVIEALERGTGAPSKRPSVISP
ncbi:hypothetical protein PoB_007157900 [Plakobranchus ocellatus]|uniref:ABC transporter domain-containing protein n=1 Tax=Plakobranchus ocellatus TaxID=259542 RepID=A0AAV4DM49_9GAST|nr:hypothetical protein PoB_007157900 [Plakobranchus ocellatus]